jgi:hypothetical protein
LGEAGAMIDFPASPTTGQQFTAAGVTWTWDGAKWAAQGLGVAYLPLAGGTMLGPIVLAGDPTAALQPVSLQYFNARPMIGDNRLINGDMRIDQRWNGVAQTAVFSYTVDRWEYRASQAAKGSWGRAAGPASQGFPYALAFISSTAYAVIANDYFLFDQIIEADMLSDLAWGSASAQPVTLSFVAQSSLTGTFCGSIQNSAQNRSYVFTYSIPVAGVATKISVTIPGDTGGAWVLSGNAGGARVVFTLAAGSGYSASPNAWSAGAFFTAAGAVSVVATLNATFFITGVKLESGGIATPFNRQSLAKSLADCQRYYYQPTGLMLSNGYNAAAGQVHNSVYLPVAMRVAPTVTPSNQAYNNASGLAVNNVDLAFYRTSLSITAVGYGYCNYNATFSAEL